MNELLASPTRAAQRICRHFDGRPSVQTRLVVPTSNSVPPVHALDLVGHRTGLR